MIKKEKEKHKLSVSEIKKDRSSAIQKDRNKAFTIEQENIGDTFVALNILNHVNL